MNLKKKSFFQIIFSFILLSTGFSESYAQQYRISLLTCDPGEEIYSSFGHSAVRVQDLQTGQDLVYNYGTFDFGAPNFVLNFATGRLDYFLSRSTFERFIAEYNYFERSVREQELALNQAQKLALMELLEINYMPQNRAYRYDFFYDNCATRIIDLMDEVLGDQLVWHNEEQQAVEKTFRQLIDEKVFYMPWSDLGIDLALGSRLDQDASPREEQFLPSYMEEAFARAEIEGDGPTRSLVSNNRVILDFQAPQGTLGTFNPYLLFWIVAILFIITTYIGFKKKKLFIGFDLAFFGILGLVGLVMAALWIASDIPSTKYNWNILWAFPGHLLLIPGLLSKTFKPWVKQYLLIALILADAAIVFWILGWQSFHPSLIPLMLVVILRTNYLYYNLERFKKRLV
ncbi:Lnb N-terminal periplasmic domain-containing protein [Algoriphagus machipongonensis]|uniref:Membrane protein n=1 Tax=Algoriphagus machipongonensis TaxID=388413 RepID=A3HY76_9BACT|nr:DUF4105 domain-containing protein [Algoriphagus machipongonensis]EAZ81549.1 membrane protein [Algoriphagus machipongonensis]